MNKLGKVISTLLCGALIMPLAACNGGGKREMYAQQSLQELYKRFDGDIEQGTERKPIYLRVLENDTAKKQGYLDELINGFNAMYADKHIIAVDANQDQYSNLAENGPYGYGPDVLYQANDALMKYCEGKHIIPLPVDKLDAYKKLPELAKEAYTYQHAGQEFFMGVGVNIQAPMMYYRKDLIPQDWKIKYDENNNDVFDPLEDMRAMYRFSVERKNSSDGKLYGYMHSLDDPYFASGYLFTYGAYVFGEGGTDYEDIGFNKADSAKGAACILQLASSMNSGCIDNSITLAREEEFAKGTYFAISNTQDMYTTMVDYLKKEYRKQTPSLSADAADQLAKENIGALPLPALPESGDLSSTAADEALLQSVVMGGINGYAISSYTKYPKASLAFLNYATSYEMIMQRNASLGIAPAREDCNRDCTNQPDVSHELLKLVEEKRVSIMPSISQVDQIWTPLSTAFIELATDPYRNEGEKKYYAADGSPNMVGLQSLLDSVERNIHDAIFKLS